MASFNGLLWQITALQREDQQSPSTLFAKGDQDCQEQNRATKLQTLKNWKSWSTDVMNRCRPSKTENHGKLISTNQLETLQQFIQKVKGVTGAPRCLGPICVDGHLITNRVTSRKSWRPDTGHQSLVTSLWSAMAMGQHYPHKLRNTRASPGLHQDNVSP